MMLLTASILIPTGNREMQEGTVDAPCDPRLFRLDHGHRILVNTPELLWDSTSPERRIS